MSEYACFHCGSVLTVDLFSLSLTTITCSCLSPSLPPSLSISSLSLLIPFRSLTHPIVLGSSDWLTDWSMDDSIAILQSALPLPLPFLHCFSPLSLYSLPCLLLFHSIPFPSSSLPIASSLLLSIPFVPLSLPHKVMPRGVIGRQPVTQCEGELSCLFNRTKVLSRHF